MNVGDLDEDPGTLSPPIIVEPLYACGSTVVVRGFIPGATVTLDVAGTPVSKVGIDPNGLVFDLNAAGLGPLSTTDRLEATQTWSGVTSGPSNEVYPSDHLVDFPDGLPQPIADPTPFRACGRAVAGHVMPIGSFVEWERDDDYSMTPPPTFLTTFESWSEWPGASVPPLDEGDHLRVRYSICGDPSPYSAPPEPVLRPPEEPLPNPEILGDYLVEGQQIVTVNNALYGATLDVFLNGDPTPVAEGIQFQGYGRRQDIRLPVTLAAGDTVEVTQRFCEDAVPTGLTTTVAPCASLPPPQIVPPEIGDETVSVDVYVPGARIRIYADGVEVGDGGGGLIRLTRPLAVGETVTVVQSVGECVSDTAHVVGVACGRVFANARNLSNWGAYRAATPVEYEVPGTITIADRPVELRGRVSFPVEPLSPSDELAGGSRSYPIVLIMHGNSVNLLESGMPTCSNDEFLVDAAALPGNDRFGSFRGYDTLLTALARSGVIAVSIDADDINCGCPTCGVPSVITRQNDTSQLFIEHLQYWKQQRDGSAPSDPFAGAFTGRVDLSRVALAGHSRGGERVPFAIARNMEMDPEIQVRAAILIAPSNNSGWSEMDFAVPTLVIQGDRDGDVQRAGIGFYDTADARPRSLMFVYGANHKFWNSRWETTGDEFTDFYGGTVMNGSDMRSLLAAWGRAWVDWHLQGIGGPLARDVFRGRARYGGLPDESAFPSFEDASFQVVDRFENGAPDVTTLGTSVLFSGFDTIDEFDCSGDFSTDCNHLTRYLDGSWTSGGVDIQVELAGFDASQSNFLAFRAGARLPDEAATGSDVILNVSLGNSGFPPMSSFASTLGDVGARIPRPILNTRTPGWKRGAMRSVYVPMQCLSILAEEFDAQSLSDLIFTSTSSEDGLLMDDIGFAR